MDRCSPCKIETDVGPGLQDEWAAQSLLLLVGDEQYIFPKLMSSKKFWDGNFLTYKIQIDTS